MCGGQGALRPFREKRRSAAIDGDDERLGQAEKNLDDRDPLQKGEATGEGPWFNSLGVRNSGAVPTAPGLLQRYLERH